MAQVTNRNGYTLDFDAASQFMDEDLLNEILWQIFGGDCEENDQQDLFSAYEKAHEEKFGEEWELSKENPCW